MSRANRIVNNIIDTRKLDKKITRRQYQKHVETLRGQRGFLIKSRRKGEYEILIRWHDYSFNWLGWENPHKNVWDMMETYPDKLLKWIYDTTGYNLDNISDKELITFLYKTGMIVVKGEPSRYGYAKANVIINHVYETLVNSLQRMNR